MKKIICVLLVIFSQIINIFANPIVLPKAMVSEFMFDEKDNWALEIIFNLGTLSIYNDFDSLYIFTSSGMSRIKTDNLKDTTSLLVVRQENLITPLLINRGGDCIKIYSFLSKKYNNHFLIDSLCFGSYSGSVIDSIPKGYSVCWIREWDVICKDKSPTIGIENDTSGTTGMLTGFMYDDMNNLITKGDFRLENPIIFFCSKYSTPIFSHKTSFCGLANNYKPDTQQGVRIDSFSLNLYPSTIIEKDIHILDKLLEVNKKEIKPDYEITLINYPNPFNSSTNFFIKIPDKWKNETTKIDIFNTTGQLVKSIVVNNKNNVYWDGKDMEGKIVASGIYYYSLNIANQIVKTCSMILLK